ncbi:hypothetical protein LTS08_001150 [Lithohypha guttulata]|nr:hypothetical protein LTS08_001150 [Lithohypha guttulata]
MASAFDGATCSNNKDDNLVTYEEALSRIRRVAAPNHVRNATTVNQSSLAESTKNDSSWKTWNESETFTSPLLRAVGLISAQTLVAPHATPEYDTSAMDGFAVCSASTVHATEEHPLTFRVVDSIAAGDSFKCKLSSNTECHEAERVCVEIMTGAVFPENRLPQLDGVVKIEDVVMTEDYFDGGQVVSRCIRVSQPVKARQHRRPAGSDFQKGDLLIQQGDQVQPCHVAALASLGLHELCVYGSHKLRHLNLLNTEGKLDVAVLSTGSEVLSHSPPMRQPYAMDPEKHIIPDSNGPYLVSTLRQKYPNLAVRYVGVAIDKEEALLNILTDVLRSGCETVITSGGVSRGRYDLIRYVVETLMGGKVIFHGVKIRPGAPLLFATFDDDSKKGIDLTGRRVAFFGVPGNPVAAAAALQFFVVPYLEARLSTIAQTTNACYQLRRVINGPPRAANNMTMKEALRRKPKNTTVFWLSRRSASDSETVEITEDQASYKLSGLLEADSWVLVPATQTEIFRGDMLACCPL